MSSRKTKVSLGIIGCGRQSSKLLIAIRETGLFEVTALCDIRQESLDAFAKALEDQPIKLLTNDYNELIESGLAQAVLVATPTNSHIEIAIKALNKNLHIFMEKPLGLDGQEVDKFIELAQNKPELVVQVELPFHHANYLGALSQILDNEDYGRCKFMVIHEHRGPFLGSWFYDSTISGGAINDKMIHFFEIANLLFHPAVPVDVYASGGQHSGKNKLLGVTSKDRFTLEKNDVVDHASIVVNYSSGQMLTATMNMYQVPPVEGTFMSLTGQSGKHVQARISGSDVTIQKSAINKEFGEYVLVDQNDMDQNQVNHPGVIKEFEDFYENIVSKRQPSANLWQARQSQIIAWAAEESVKKKRIVSLDKYDSHEISRKADSLGWRNIPKFRRYHLIEKHLFAEKPSAVGRDWVDSLSTTLRRFFPKKQGVNRIGLETMAKLLESFEKDREFVNSVKSIDLRMIVTLPWESWSVQISDGKFTIGKVNAPKDSGAIEFKLTEEGFEGVITGRSLVKLYLSGHIKIIGDLTKLQSEQAELSIFINKLRESIGLGQAI